MIAKTFAFVVAVALTSVTFTPAVSATAVHQHVEVAYHDLDLATDEGRSILIGRIDETAKQICGYYPSTTTNRSASRAARLCYQETLETLEEQFASVILDARRDG